MERKTYRSIVMVLSVILFFTLFTFLCSLPSASAADEIVFATVDDLSGPYAASGDEGVKAVELALGSLGHKLRQGSSSTYEILARIHRRNTVTTDSQQLALLLEGVVLDYDGTGEPWVDVHPLVQDCEEFRRAWASEIGIQRAM